MSTYNDDSFWQSLPSPLWFSVLPNEFVFAGVIFHPEMSPVFCSEFSSLENSSEKLQMYKWCQKWLGEPVETELRYLFEDFVPDAIRKKAIQFCREHIIFVLRKKGG